MPLPTRAITATTPATPPAVPTTYSVRFAAFEKSSPSCITPKRTPMARIRSPTQVQPAAMSPMRPASGPTEPPKAMGSKNATAEGATRPRW